MRRASGRDDLRPARLRPSDLLRTSASGVRARPLRTVLSALGIAIGIAAMLTMVGISTSSQAQLNVLLERLGTNLLTASPGTTFAGTPAKLPLESIAMVRRIGPVTADSATATLPNVAVYRNQFIPVGQTSSIEVRAAYAGLAGVVGAHIQDGRWFSDQASIPTVVLGYLAAQRLGVSQPGVRVWLGGQWFGVVGVLAAVPLALELDSSALVSWPTAERFLGFGGNPTLLYVRCVESQVEAVQGVLGATANPAAPDEVLVSRPSDALAAKRSASYALNAQLLGLGVVALLIGGVGVANTMVISVLERRGEIGLRRSLGATRGHIRIQFLTESVVLSVGGGVAGGLLGFAATAAFAWLRSWPPTLPWWALVGSVVLPGIIGALAGLYPAERAARLAPTQALAAL